MATQYNTIAQAKTASMIEHVAEINPVALCDLAREFTGKQGKIGIDNAKSLVFRYINNKHFSSDVMDKLIAIHPDYAIFRAYFKNLSEVNPDKFDGKKTEPMNACGCTGGMLMAEGDSEEMKNVDDTVAPTKRLKVGAVATLIGAFVISMGIVASLIGSNK